MAEGLLSQPPRVLPPLDPEFRPAWLANRAFRTELAGRGVPLGFALERSGGELSTFSTEVFPAEHSLSRHNARYAERLLKFLLWQRGAWKVTIAGPAEIAAAIAAEYAPGGGRAFDAEFMAKVYDVPAFVIDTARELPPSRERGQAIGGHLDGCRIGFDAGGSDRKVAALIDGKEVFSCEVVWQPKLESDPEYHVAGVHDSIRRAAAHLPRVDAIGVSSAGIYVDNRTRVASLFRKVSPEAFAARIENIYLDVAREWGGVPIEVANDGDVAALAGAMALGVRPVLGIAMGTSQAAGYVDSRGLLTGWLNELAFAPVDYAASAVEDREWSGDRGTGVGYFSQDAVIRLASRAGLALDGAATPAEKLAAVQALAEAGDERARAVFESIGVYFGYGLLHYSDFYELEHVLLLGRVSSGAGGGAILTRALEVLRLEAPELAPRIRVHLPGEATRRVGQAIAAASLPRISK